MLYCQLQQAIKILQMSSLELEQEIAQMLETNVMLETNQLDEEITADDSVEDMQGEEQDIPSDVAEDYEWSDVYDDLQPTPSSLPDAPSSSFESYTAEEQSVFQQLHEQLLKLNLDDEAFEISEFIIDGLDERGYLTLSYEDIADQTNTLEYDVELVHERLMDELEPTGITARDLQECLAQQAKNPNTPIEYWAQRIIEDFWPEFSEQKWPFIRRKLEINDEDLAEILTFIRTLDPFPAQSISGDNNQYIQPDLYAFKHLDEWHVSLNSSALPKLSLNQLYMTLIEQAPKGEDLQAIKDQLQEAKWFLSSLENRNSTLLKVGQEIIKRQKAFFEQGDEFMKPMILRDIADEIEVHESTISRATSQKYMQTPNGTYELKYFFSSQVQAGLDEGTSATAIKAKIRKLIDAEPAKKPLSDNKLTQLLNDEGIPVARRTVAKYREAINIPSSSERKKMRI